MSARLAFVVAVALFVVVVAAGCDGPPPPPSKIFLWGVANSSYQVEGGIDCASPPSPCNDYDFFNSNENIRVRVAFNSRRIGPEIVVQPAGEAVRFSEERFYTGDFDNARMLGANAFRISLEWGRIEPEAPTVNGDGTLTHRWNEGAIRHYRRMIDAMVARGLTPVVSLNHFTLPEWVLTPPVRNLCVGGPACVASQCHNDDGSLLCHAVPDQGYESSLKGWENDATVERFADFVSKVVPELEDRVDYWLTINEPVGSQVALGYLAGIWSPGFVGDGTRAKAALLRLIKAHVRAFDVITTCGPLDEAGRTVCDDSDADGDGTVKLVGAAHAMGVATPALRGFAGSDERNSAAAENFGYFLNDYFLHAVVNGEEDTRYLNDVVDGNLPKRQDVTHHEEWVNKIDFVGLNYYRRFHVYYDDKLNLVGTGFLGGSSHNNLFGEPDSYGLLNDLGWEMYPQGLYDLVMRVGREWKKPVLITENGLPERVDRNRAPYLVAHIRELARAIGDGAEVLGYMHWTLTDNWELHENWREDARFGLFRVERVSRDPGACADNCRRTINESALAYRELIAESRAASSAGAPTTAAADRVQEKFGAVAADGSRVIPPRVSHGQVWAGQTATGSRLSLYLTSSAWNQHIRGLMFWADTGTWRSVNLIVDSRGPVLRESWFDALDGAAHRDHLVSYARREWRGRYLDEGVLTSWRAVPQDEVGLWRWSGSSPWGGQFFAINDLGGMGSAKFLTFANQSAQDVPSEGGCPPTGCVPSIRNPSWRELRLTHDADRITLAAIGAQGDELFDLMLNPVRGPDGIVTATTTAKRSGTVTMQKASQFLAAPFGFTGYVKSAGELAWGGERDGSATSKFAFLETRALFREYRSDPEPLGTKDDQYWKEMDPTSVMPLANFTYTPHAGGGTVSFEAGGRAYSATAGLLGCAVPEVCSGTWRDIGGRVAVRLENELPPVAVAGDDQRVIGSSDGAQVTLEGGRSFDLVGAVVSHSWTGPFGSRDGASVSVVVPPGVHNVCLTVTSRSRASTDCVTVEVSVA